MMGESKKGKKWTGNVLLRCHGSICDACPQGRPRVARSSEARMKKLAEQIAKKAEENMWIGQMVVAESIGELDRLIRSCAT